MPQDKAPKPERRPPGPDAEHLKIEADDWEGAVRKAVRKPSPPGGWPKPAKRKRHKK